MMNSAQNKILVPVDFSEHSLIGLEQSYNLAKLSKSEITLLHIIIESDAFAGLFSVKEQESVIDVMKTKLESFAQVVAKKSGVKVNTLVESGKLLDKIIEVSERPGYKFIVVGTTTLIDLKHRIIGSNALRIVRNAKCPVITTRDKYHKKCDNIILPLDMTKGTIEKVSKATKFAKLFDSKIHAVSVVTDKNDAIIKSMKTELEQVKELIQKQNVECSIELIKSEKKKETMAKNLIDYAHKVQGDLIIIMTQQKDAISEYFIGVIGSFAKEIIHRSDIPVMSITPKLSDEG